MVIAYHAGLPMPGGFVGVDVFFVISGFVITGMLLREWRQRARIRFVHFYFRRFKRLTPALATMVTFTIALSMLLLSPFGAQQVAAKTAIGSMLVVANFVIVRVTGGYFDPPATINPLLNTWSLSVEEQFYLVFPALLGLGLLMQARRASLKLSPLFIISTVALISFALAVAGAHGLRFPGSDLILGFYSPFTRAWEFCMGAILCISMTKFNPLPMRIATSLGLIGLFSLGLAALLITDGIPFPGTTTLLPVGGTLCLLLSGESSSALTSRLLSKRPFTYVGDRSYSLYLWHWPLIVFAAILIPGSAIFTVLAAALSIPLALASFRWVEQPIRNLRSMDTARKAWLIGSSTGVPLVAALVLLVGSNQSWWQTDTRDISASIFPLHAANARGCDSREPLSDSVITRCSFNEASSPHTIFLLGDSHADQLSEALVTSLRGTHVRAVVATAYSCPLIDEVLLDTRPGADNEECRRYVQDTLKYLSNSERSMVIISNSLSYWLSQDFEAGNEKDSVSSVASDKLKTFASALKRTVTKLQQAGHQVVLAQDIPGVPWDPYKCTWIQVVGDGCSASVSLSEALSSYLPIRDELLKVAMQTKTPLWDPVPLVCEGEVCSSHGPGFVRYQDSGHISVEQSQRLYPSLRKFLEQLCERKETSLCGDLVRL